MVFSANDLKNVKTFGGKMSPYCVVWIYPNMKVATPMDTNGGENPTWNSKLRLVCEESLIESGNAVVTIDIYNHGSFSNKLIGTSQLPVAQLPVTGGADNKAGDQSGIGGSQAKSLTLPIRRPSGRAQGTLNASVKIGEKVKLPPAATWGASNLSDRNRAPDQPPVMAYPAPAGYPAAASTSNYPGQYPPQYASQGTPYYPPAQAGGYYQQPPPAPRRNGFGGAGFGTGLLGGALGGFL